MPENRCMVIPNMIEIPKNFQPLIKLPITKKIRLGSLGRLSFEKNFDKVIKSIPILLNHGYEVEYVIGGVGIESENLYLTAKNLGIEKNFKILGWVEDKRKFFSEIDIFILPSFGETFGIVLLEAMLYNTPIISSNSWGPDEIISHQVNGLKISKDDSDIMPELIAKQVISLQQNPELVATIIKNAYEDLIKKYTSDVVSEKLIEICNKIIKQSI
jgi:glycosyltransferase involved in cell wall biosynthesis